MAAVASAAADPGSLSSSRWSGNHVESLCALVSAATGVHAVGSSAGDHAFRSPSVSRTSAVIAYDTAPDRSRLCNSTIGCTVAPAFTVLVIWLYVSAPAGLTVTRRRMD